jgi:hypothetical protein
MRKIQWHDWLEGIGIIAIVSSLIFVGLQLRQAEKIALAEGHAATMSNLLEVGNSVKADVNIWNRGATGEELTDDEAAIFAVLVRQINDSAYFGYMQALELAGEEEARFNATDFAIFLYNNPGAKRVWLAREEYLIKYRDLINPTVDSFSSWKEMVMDDLDILASKGAPNQKTPFIVW